MAASPAKSDSRARRADFTITSLDTVWIDFSYAEDGRGFVVLSRSPIFSTTAQFSPAVRFLAPSRAVAHYSDINTSHSRARASTRDATRGDDAVAAPSTEGRPAE